MAHTPEPREAMDFDVVIVGAGPAGLAAAIRLRQLAEEKGEEVSVVVLEKGSEVGTHILSGAVIDPIGLDRLIPDWRARGAPVSQEVTTDRFLYLTEARAVRLPTFAMPPCMSNHGNYIVSLGDVVRWLGEQAEALGVEIYPGFPATEILTGPNGVREVQRERARVVLETVCTVGDTVVVDGEAVVKTTSRAKRAAAAAAA